MQQKLLSLLHLKYYIPFTQCACSKRISLSLVFISKELVYHKVLLCLNSQDTISLYRMQWVWCEANIVYATSQFIHYIHPNILFTMAVCCTDKHNSSMQWRWVVFFLTLIKWDWCATVALVLSWLVINPCLYLWYYISCPTKEILNFIQKGCHYACRKTFGL